MTQQVKAGVSEGLVHRLRDAYRLTQKEAGVLLDVHCMTLSKLENGRCALNRDLRDTLLILLDVSKLPGVVEHLRHVLMTRGGGEARWLAQLMQKVGQ